jgi:hypothetical protein
MQRFIALLALAAPALGSVVTNAQISGVGTDVVSASARAYYNPCGFSPCGSDPSFISASAQVTGLTLGPVRPGFIEISGNGDGDYGAGMASVGSYYFLCGEVCPLGAPILMPFTLGVSFDIDVGADAMMLGPVYGAGVINFQFSLFEVNQLYPSLPGASVIVYDASSVSASAPEPATYTAVGLGLLGLAARDALKAFRNRKSLA